jgi:chromosome partitioning protein
MMKVVSIMNNKGGVGKTTITANLAAYIASKGRRVLIMDVDPQTNLTFSFIKTLEWEKRYAKSKTLKDFFRPILEGNKNTVSLDSLIIPLDVESVRIDIISSHLDLIDIDTDLAANLGGANLTQLANNYITAHNYLRDNIATLKEKYDFILIDCAPNFNIVTKNALATSDHYLAPSKMDFLSTFGVMQLTRNVDKFVRQYNEYMKCVKGKSTINPTILGVVATMVGINNEMPIVPNQNYINDLKIAGYEIFDTYIRENKTLYSMTSSNKAPVIFSQKSDTTTTKVVNELKAFGEEFMRKVERLKCPRQ